MNYEDIIIKTYQYVKEASAYNDMGHDYLHVLRVVSLAKKIGSNYKNCDMFLVEMSALLHDVEDDKLKSKKYYSVKDFLSSNGLDLEMINKITKYISFVSYSKNNTKNDNIPLEAKIIQDADRIDAIGAVGVARTFAFSAANNIPFYDDSKNIHSTLDHFEEKLFKLYDLLNTKEAKEIALKRHEFMKTYYNQFLDEIK